MNHKKKLSFALLATIASVLTLADDTVKVEFPFKAESGRFRRQQVAPPAEAFTVKGTLQLDKAEATTLWAASAGIVLGEKPGADNSLQTMVMYYQGAENQKAGFLQIEDRKELRRITPLSVTPGTPVPVEISFDKGTVSLRLDKGETVRIQLPFTAAGVSVMGVGGEGKIQLEYTQQEPTPSPDNTEDKLTVAAPEPAAQ